MRDMAKDFSAGQFDPFFVVLTKADGDLVSEEGYKAMLQLCAMLETIGVPRLFSFQKELGL